MNFLHKLGAVFGGDGPRTVVGKDKKGNSFFTLAPNRAGEPPKRLVDYKGEPDPSALHPLWKHWLSHVRETAPTDRDIFAWEMDQARLRQRLKEIDAASNKMKAEEMAERERGEPDFANGFAELMARVAAQQGDANQAARGSSDPRSNEAHPSPSTKFSVPPQSFTDGGPPTPPPGPKPGENITFENGIKVVPKEHKPYSPDPSRLQSILQKKGSNGQPEPTTKSDPSAPPTANWSPNTKSFGNNDDL